MDFTSAKALIFLNIFFYHLWITVTRVIASGDLLTWPELNVLVPALTEQLSDGAPGRYLDGAIFSINYEGVEYFPRFAIESQSLTIASLGMQRVIAVLATRMNVWGMALWFESSNS